jgi:hypothetical protein
VIFRSDSLTRVRQRDSCVDNSWPRQVPLLLVDSVGCSGGVSVLKMGGLRRACEFSGELAAVWASMWNRMVSADSMFCLEFVIGGIRDWRELSDRRIVYDA